MANVIPIEEARFDKQTNESARARWYVGRIQAAFKVAEQIGGVTFERFGEVGRAAKIYGRWPMLFAIEDMLAEVFWGRDRKPPTGQEIQENSDNPEWTWLDRRMMAALSAFAADADEGREGKRAAVLTLGVMLAEAREECGPWAVLFAIEQLAAMVVNADGRRENGAPQVRVWREVDLQPEASA